MQVSSYYSQIVATTLTVVGRKLWILTLAATFAFCRKERNCYATRALWLNFNIVALQSALIILNLNSNQEIERLSICRTCTKRKLLRDFKYLSIRLAADNNNSYQRKNDTSKRAKATVSPSTYTSTGTFRTLMITKPHVNAIITRTGMQSVYVHALV